jgi:hypothetical protein
MKNCLFTKYNTEVENNNFPVYGELVLHVKNNDSSKQMPISIGNTAPFDAYIVGNGNFYKGTIANPTDVTTELTGITSTNNYYLSQGEYDVHITKRYSITYIGFGYENLNSCSYEVSFDFNNLMYSPLTDIKAEVFTGTGDLDNFENLTSVGIRANENIKASFAKVAEVVSIGDNQRYPALGWKDLAFENFVENANSSLYGKTIKPAQNVFLAYYPTMNGSVATSITTVFDVSGNATVSYYLYPSGTSKMATYTKATNTWVYD